MAAKNLKWLDTCVKRVHDCATLLSTLKTANVVARALAEAIEEVARRAGTTPSSGRFVAETGIEIGEWGKLKGREVLE